MVNLANNSFDLEKMHTILDEYKSRFRSELWPNEDYKWKAVKTFQNSWNVEATDFAEMLDASLKDTSNLLTSAQRFAKGMIVDFATLFPEDVRSMFINLFDESIDVYERINNFIVKADELLPRWSAIRNKPDGRMHYQNINAVTTYLWLRYPDKYYIFKHGIVKTVAEKLGGAYSFKSSSSRDKDSDESNQTSHLDDDYDLYNVAYFDGEKLFVNGEENTELASNYKHLRTQLSNLKAIIEKEKTCQSIISDCLVRLLEKPMFLFKDISYSLEEESRIIISRDFSDRDEIRKTSAENMSKKIFINPPLQIFPYKIILGPKVENADFLIPYLQYKLSEIKDKWNYDNDYEPVVRKSEINIR